MMKTLFRPIPLFIASACLLTLLLVVYFFSGDSEDDSPKIYRIGIDSSWSSWDLDGKVRELTAFTEELLQKIALQEKIQIRLARFSGDSLFPALKREAVDAVITGDAPNETLATLRFVISDAFYDLGDVLVTRDDSKISSLDNLKGVILGVLKGSSVTSEINFDPTIFIVTYENALNALQRVDDKSIDAALLPFVPAYVYVHSLYDGRLKVASKPIASDGVRLIAFRTKAGEQLVTHFSRGLKTMIEEGTYQALLTRWSLPDPQHPDAVPEESE